MKTKTIATGFCVLLFGLVAAAQTQTAGSFAWEVITGGAYWDPEFMAANEAFGKAISVKTGPAGNVELQLIPAP